MCHCEANRVMDIKTPRNVHLSAFYRRSFAYHTVKNRMPVILTSVIDNLARNKLEIAEECGANAQEDLKKIIGDLSEFKYEVQTNKPLKNLTGGAPDVHIYNAYIANQTSKEGYPTHFHTIWLLTECYMYRRIREIFENTQALRNYDPFKSQKQESFRAALPLINQMAKHTLEIVEGASDANQDEFVNLLKLNLWGNKCDLSISLGQVKEHSALFDVASLDPNILSDHSVRIWEAVSDSSAASDIIDIILDNVGYEVFTDLCLADYMVSKNLAKTIRFYVKTVPWFISDVMTHDFNWTLEQLKLSSNVDLQQLGERWNNYIENGTWGIEESDFWTLPFDFTYMPKVNPKLYKQLAKAKVAFFKGDLNYRKLFGEFNWDPATSVDVMLQNFNPTKLCILRTIKADIVCGLEEGLAEKIEAQDPTWMETEIGVSYNSQIRFS